MALTNLAEKPAPEPLNQYLQGDYEPVQDEMTILQLSVTGKVPAALNGLLLRNGPNPLAPISEPYHWFSGDGMLHGVRLGGGRALWYRNRWVRTSRFCARRSLPDRGGTPDVFGENPANTSVLEHAGRILALNEVGFPYEITEDLQTVGRHDFGGSLHTGMSAHGKVDPTTGELIFYGYAFAPPFLSVYVVSPGGQVLRCQPVDLPRPVMMHDFAFTRSHIILLDLPVVFDLQTIASTGLPFRWKREAGARLGLLSRQDLAAPVRWIELDPCYALHTMNAFERDDGEIVLDLIAYDSLCDGQGFGPWESLPNRLERWTVDPAQGRVARTVLDAQSQEMPRIDPRRVGGEYRYGYTLAVRELGGGLGAIGDLLKHDHRTATVERHRMPETSQAGECVFVPASPGGAEDEGWILTLVSDRRRGRAELLILDAQNFAGEPVATVHLPARLPQGFHAAWVPERPAKG